MLTDPYGRFFWDGDYSCTPGTQVYAYALGGSSGGPQNGSIGLLAILGTCPKSGNFNAGPSVWINEVSTVASAYAFAGYAVDPTHVFSSDTTLGQTGIANAFANAANLETISSGVALATTPAGNGTSPQAAVNTLANVLEACVFSGGPASTPCSTLFADALAAGSTGAAPTDTATAAINIAHNPVVNVGALYGLGAAQPAYLPSLAAQPNDFTLGINFTGILVEHAGALSIDGSGNVWLFGGKGLVELSSLGVPVSSSGFPIQSANGNIAIDSAGNLWFAGASGDQPNMGLVEEYSASAAPLSGSGFDPGLNQPQQVSIDRLGNVWVADNGSVAAVSNKGAPLTPTSGFAVGGSPGPGTHSFRGSRTTAPETCGWWTMRTPRW